jgi:LPXTG-motif cell wall-anchored protein
MSFDLINSGSGAAKDIIISFEQTDDFTTPGTSGDTVISSLGGKAAEKVEIDIEIDPDASSGTSLVPVSLSYYDETGSTEYADDKSISIPISGEAEFVIGVEDLENMYYGMTGTVVVSIANKGNGVARYMTLYAKSDYGEQEIYVGDLDPDDYDTIEVTQKIVDGAGSYPLEITLEYKDIYNKEFTSSKTLTITPSSAPIRWTMIGGAVFVLLIAGFWLYRKRKKKKR